MKEALTQEENLLAARNYSAAITPYEKDVSLAPEFCEAYFAPDICYQQTGQTAKAEQSLKRYPAFQPLSEDGCVLKAAKKPFGSTKAREIA